MSEIAYYVPEEIPFPEGVNPVDMLHCVLSRAEGIISLLVDDYSGHLVRGNASAGHAVYAAIALLRQADVLVDYWHKLETEKRNRG